MINNNKQNNVKESVKTSSLASELSPRGKYSRFSPSFLLSLVVPSEAMKNQISPFT